MKKFCIVMNWVTFVIIYVILENMMSTFIFVTPFEYLRPPFGGRYSTSDNLSFSLNLAYCSSTRTLISEQYIFVILSVLALNLVSRRRQVHSLECSHSGILNQFPKEKWEISNFAYRITLMSAVQCNFLCRQQSRDQPV